MINCVLSLIIAAANIQSISSNPTFDTGSIIIKVPRNLTSVGYLILHRFIKISFSETTGISDSDIEVADANETRKLQEKTEPEWRTPTIAPSVSPPRKLQEETEPGWRRPTIAPSVSPPPTLAISTLPTTSSPTSQPASPVISFRRPSQEPTLVSPPSQPASPVISWRVPSQEPTLVSPPGISWRIPTPTPTQSGDPINSWRQPTPSPTLIAELHYVAKTFLITIGLSDKPLFTDAVSSGRFSDQLAVHIISKSGTGFSVVGRDLNNRVTLLSISSLNKIEFKGTRSTPIDEDGNTGKRPSESGETDLLYLVCLVAIIPIVFLVCFILRKRREKKAEEASIDPIPSPSSLSLSEHNRTFLYTGKANQRISFQSKENPLNTENPFHFESDAYYDILGLNIENATTADIKTAYERLKSTYTLDTDSSVEADGMLFKIEEAYRTLLLKHKTMDEAGNLWNFKSMLHK